jgi:hypothetical protein
MEYLCRYLGALSTKPCGECTNCRRYGEKYDHYRATMPEVDAFLATCYPRINARGEHQGGFVLDFHGGTDVGEAVSRAKYGSGGIIDDWVVDEAVTCIQTKYQQDEGAIDALTFIPPRAAGPLVEDLARRLAERLGVPFVALLARTRETELHKEHAHARGEASQHSRRVCRRRGHRAGRPVAPFN